MSDETIAISESAPGDAAAVLELQRLAYRAEAELYDNLAIPPLTQTLEDLRADYAGRAVLKAVTGEGRLVGSVRARLDGDVCRIGRLMVHPGFQGRGVGGRLLAAIEARFPQAARYALFTGRRSLANLRFYERRGYARCAETPAGPGLVLVHLEKPGPR
ncbi:MAG: GNAT family N-acetyltransferase [Desulfovibrionaceae bacterium]